VLVALAGAGPSMSGQPDRTPHCPPPNTFNLTNAPATVAMTSPVTSIRTIVSHAVFLASLKASSRLRNSRMSGAALGGALEQFLEVVARHRDHALSHAGRVHVLSSRDKKPAACAESPVLERGPHYRPELLQFDFHAVLPARLPSLRLSSILIESSTTSEGGYDGRFRELR